MRLVISNPTPLRMYPTARLLQIVERREFARLPEDAQKVVYRALDERTPLKLAA